LTKLFGVEYKFVNYLNWTTEYLSLIFSIALIVLIFRDIIYYEKKVNTENFQDIPKTTRWLKRTLVYGIALCILWLISITFLRSILGKGYYKYYPLWIGISILIYWIGYTYIIQNILYRDRQQIRKKLDKEKNKKSSITNVKSKNKFEEIHQFVLENQLYLDTEMTLSMLSKKIKISEGYLSQLINKNHGKNYNDYINGLRIEYVKKILVNDEYSNYTITAIGLEAGFKTKTSFSLLLKNILEKHLISIKN
jgi:AraC-like DNA-binding protein